MVKKITVKLEYLVEGKIFLSNSLIIRVSNKELTTIKKDLNSRRIRVFTYGVDAINGETCEIYNKSFDSVYPDNKGYKVYRQKLEEAKLW